MSAARIEGFDVKRMPFRGTCRDILVSRTGHRPVTLMHELYGLTESFSTFAHRLMARDCQIYLPVMFGSSDPTAGHMGTPLALPGNVAKFQIFSHKDPGPWPDWIRYLAAHEFEAAWDIQSKGVGVIDL